METAEFEHFVQQLDPAFFAAHLIIEGAPYVFDKKRAPYMRWKIELGNRIGVDPSAICICGSGSVGFSLDPDKHPKKFGQQSDLDVAAVSSYHFELAWNFLRDESSSLSPITDEIVKVAISEHKKRHVFDGVIDTRRILPYLPFGQTWTQALSDMSIKAPADGREVNIRLYRDHNALSRALIRSINALRARIHQA